MAALLSQRHLSDEGNPIPFATRWRPVRPLAIKLLVVLGRFPLRIFHQEKARYNKLGVYEVGYKLYNCRLYTVLHIINLRVKSLQPFVNAIISTQQVAKDSEIVSKGTVVNLVHWFRRRFSICVLDVYCKIQCNDMCDQVYVFINTEFVHTLVCFRNGSNLYSVSWII